MSKPLMVINLLAIGFFIAVNDFLIRGRGHSHSGSSSWWHFFIPGHHSSGYYGGHGHGSILSELFDFIFIIIIAVIIIIVSKSRGK